MQPDKNEIAKLFIEGYSIPKIMQEMKTSFYTVKDSLIELGVYEKRHYLAKKLNTSEIINDYKNGLSVLALSKKYDVARSGIVRRLKSAGIQIRSGSEANYIRFKNASDEYKKEIVKKANQAMKLLPKSFHLSNSIKQAERKQITLSKIGSFELNVSDFLKQHGFCPTLQLRCFVYNIDVFIPGIAIEIHANSGHPHNMPYYLKRIKILMENNHSVIYIKVLRSGITDSGLIGLLNLISTIKASNEVKYYLIRGTGEVIANYSYIQL